MAAIRDWPVFLGKTSAVVISAASLSLLPILFAGEALALFLRVQAVVITVASLSNLGAVPYVADACAAESSGAAGILQLWLQRRLLAVVLIAPVATAIVFHEHPLREVILVSIAVALWSFCYSYDLTDVGLVSAGAPMQAACVAVSTATGGLLLRVLIAYLAPFPAVVVSCALIEASLRFGVQHRLLLRRLSLMQPSAGRGTHARTRAIDDAPVFVASIVNAASNRIDQLAAGAFLADAQANIYFLASRLVDAIWFIPFTTINLALSKRAQNGLDEGSRWLGPTARRILGSNLAGMAVLVVAGLAYETSKSSMAGLALVLSISAASLFSSSVNAAAWRLEAARGERATGLFRALIQLGMFLLSLAGAWLFLERKAIDLACACIVARMLSVATMATAMRSVRKDFLKLARM